VNRITAALAAANNISTIVWWDTLGINNAISDAISNAAFKAAIEELQDRRMDEWSGYEHDFYVTELPPVNGTYTGYTTQIQTIAGERDNVTNISFSNLVGMFDANHPSYASQKQFCNRFIKAMIDNGYNIDPEFLTWNATSSAALDGTGIRLTSGGGNAYVTTSYDADQAFMAVFEYGTQGSACVFVLDSNTTHVAWAGGGADVYFGSAYWYDGTLYAIDQNYDAGNVADASVVSAKGFAALERSGDDIIVKYSTNGGSSWTTLYTFTGALTGQSTIRIKILAALGEGYFDAWGGQGYSL
jgi:hypothetical protein